VNLQFDIIFHVDRKLFVERQLIFKTVVTVAVLCVCYGIQKECKGKFDWLLCGKGYFVFVFNGK